MLVLFPSVTWGQLPVASTPVALSAAMGVAAASTNRDGLAYGVAYHRLVRPHVAVGASLLFQPLNHASAQYAPPTPCPQPGCRSQYPGTGLISLLLDVELHADAARVGPYGSIGAGASYYRHPPDAGARVVPALAVGAGFDLPISIARIRVEGRYLRLVGSGVNGVDLGAATLGVVLPGCLTRACSCRASAVSVGMD